MSKGGGLFGLNREEIFRRDNIAKIFLSTSAAMIFTEITGVLSVLMDGIVTSRFLGVDAYSGISLLRPFTSLILVVAGFMSTGCGVICSQQIGKGEKETANEVFNLVTVLTLICAVLIVVFGFFMPTWTLRVCGVPLNKHPELHPYMYDYLRGYLFGIPAMMLLQIVGPILILDNGKRLFTASSIILGVVNIAGDLINVWILRQGVFGMGVATSVGYIVQLLVVCYYLIRTNSYFRISPKYFSLRLLPEVCRKGSPSLVKRLAGTLRDVVTNHFNVLLALTSAAIAAKGIQSDLFQFIFCIPSGLGRTLVAMAAIYYSANDRKGLERLYTYALRVGAKISVVVGAAVFICAPLVTRLYTNDPETVSLTVFSIRWMSAALAFDTTIVLIQHYLQGTENRKRANVLSFCERLIVPVATAIILGMLYGSKGIMASAAISKIILLLGIFAADCIRCKGLPRYWYQVMFLPEDFGGDESDNMYEEIHNKEDVLRVSRATKDFCLDHHSSENTASLMMLFVEEMTINVIEYAEQAKKKGVYVDFRLFTNGEDLCFTMMDLSDHFDPPLFYELNQEDYPQKHIGISLVMKRAKEVRYFSALNSNNLIVHLDLEREKSEEETSPA